MKLSGETIVRGNVAQADRRGVKILRGNVSWFVSAGKGYPLLAFYFHE